jgi:hypothetical protein
MRKVKLLNTGLKSSKIKLSGEYLRDNGFEIGDIISVYISTTEILIKKGIHTGQNWLRSQFIINKELKTSVIKGMRWLPDRGTGELAAKPNLPRVSDIKSKKEIDVTKYERPIEDYIPIIQIVSSVIIDNGYIVGDYLNVDFVTKGVIRLTKLNNDNNIITNNFEYTKDIEVQIKKYNKYNKNYYFILLIIILDKTILSKTNFKEGDIITLFIKDNMLYIKKGKENIPNCFYYTITKNINSKDALTFNIGNQEIFKELNLEAGDFVTLKIVSPDMLSLTKKNTESNNSINENKLSSYIRKIVRNIINESFK